MSNSGGNMSLEGSIRTCRVDSSWANKLQSDRFMNPNEMLCPVWGGVDTSGRAVCSDSFYTKTPGCSSAADRVLVENALRPQYIEYVTLDAQGIQGGLDCGVQPYENPDARCASGAMAGVHNHTGQFGYSTDYRSQIQPNCVSCSGAPDTRAQASQNMRMAQMAREGFRSQNNRRYM